ncbi:MAG: carboxymuconolactone decarboxylase family protein [Hyphomonadaceae bacterium]
MTASYASLIKDTDACASELRNLIPEAFTAFGALSRAAQAEGVLDGRTKELLALAISVAIRCDACIAYHARGALRAGASRQEVAEALGVAIQMGGGPSVNYGSHALRAYDEFEKVAKLNAAAPA